MIIHCLKAECRHFQYCNNPFLYCFCALWPWPFDPKINGFTGLMVEQIYVKSGDPICSSCWDIVQKNKYTDRQTHRQTLLKTLTLQLPAWIVTNRCKNNKCKFLGRKMRTDGSSDVLYRLLASSKARLKRLRWRDQGDRSWKRPPGNSRSKCLDQGPDSKKNLRKNPKFIISFS